MFIYIKSNVFLRKEAHALLYSLSIAHNIEGELIYLMFSLIFSSSQSSFKSHSPAQGIYLHV